MLRRFGITAILLLTRPLGAQVVQRWEKSYDGPANGEDVSKALAVDGFGNVFVTGYSTNASGNKDLYTVKYAMANGDVLWEKRYNGPRNGDDEGMAIAVGNDGNVIVTANSVASGQPGERYSVMYSSASGAVIWERRYSGWSNQGSRADAMAIDRTGSVIIAGSEWGQGNTDFYTVKHAGPTGTPLWVNGYNGTGNGDDNPLAVAVDSSGNVFVTGNSRGNTSGSDSTDIYTAKYSAANGARMWEKRYRRSGNYHDNGWSIAVDGTGNVVVAGDSEADFYIVKYAGTNGAPLWEKLYDGPGFSQDAAVAVALDASDNVVVAGPSGRDFYTAKYASGSGALLWERRNNVAGNGIDASRSVGIDGNGNVFVTGTSSTGATFDIYTASYAGEDGSLRWARSHTGLLDGYKQIALTPDGGTVGTGYTWTPRGDGFNYDYVTIFYAPPGPSVAPAAVTGLTKSQVTLNGRVNSLGLSTAAKFEYGLTNAYGTESAAGYWPDGDNTTHEVSARLDNLSPLTTYHWRLVATNAAGTVATSDATFTTLPTTQQAWRLQYFGSADNAGDGADSSDPDKDGLTNLVEWACNLNPARPGSLPVTSTLPGKHLQLTYERSTAAVSAGASFVVEWNNSLADAGWRNKDVNESILSDNGTVQRVRATIAAPDRAGRRFVRVRIIGPP